MKEFIYLDNLYPVYLLQVLGGLQSVKESTKQIKQAGTFFSYT